MSETSNPLSVLVQTGLNFKDKTDEECAELVFEYIESKDRVDGLRWYIADVLDMNHISDGADDFYYSREGTQDWHDLDLIYHIEETFHWDKLREDDPKAVKKLIKFFSEVEKK